MAIDLDIQAVLREAFGEDNDDNEEKSITSLEDLRSGGIAILEADHLSRRKIRRLLQGLKIGEARVTALPK